MNSIHAIEENGKPGTITVTINRATDQPDIEGVGPISYGRIEGFTVVDTGVGFNARNFVSFETMDSRTKAARGKGVGQLMWLLAFERARVSSVFEEGGKRRKRQFEFEPGYTLPVSATIAPARRNTIVQAADVVGHTSTSPARSVCSSPS